MSENTTSVNSRSRDSIDKQFDELIDTGIIPDFADPNDKSKSSVDNDGNMEKRLIEKNFVPDDDEPLKN